MAASLAAERKRYDAHDRTQQQKPGAAVEPQSRGGEERIPEPRDRTEDADPDERERGIAERDRGNDRQSRRRGCGKRRRLPLGLPFAPGLAQRFERERNDGSGGRGNRPRAQWQRPGQAEHRRCGDRERDERPASHARCGWYTTAAPAAVSEDCRGAAFKAAENAGLKSCATPVKIALTPPDSTAPPHR